jgi:hypothetical protein
MAKATKITTQTPAEVKVVKPYRVKPSTFKTADALSKQKYGVGVAGIIEQLIEKHFGLNPKKK